MNRAFYCGYSGLNFLSFIILPVQFVVLIVALHEIMFTFKVSSGCFILLWHSLSLRL